jgi:hypothetical protein
MTRHADHADLNLDGDSAALRGISPTDVAQFIRLEQCERYLRLRLHQREYGEQFLHDYGVTPQAIPQLLAHSGADFEDAVEDTIGRYLPTVHMVDEASDRRRAGHDNAQVLTRMQSLLPGETIVVLQPRVEVALHGWRLRGDMDILHLARASDGALRILIVDIKSSARARVEHRLQVAFYHDMLAAICADGGVEVHAIVLGILYRGPENTYGLSPADVATHIEQRVAAEAVLGTGDGLLEIIDDPRALLEAVQDLVTGEDSAATRAASALFDDVPFQLNFKCDGCIYNQFCMKWSAERDDLSLLPHLTGSVKRVLRGHGVRTMRELAALKQPLGAVAGRHRHELSPVPGQEQLVRTLAGTWPVGPQLDELIWRAQRYRRDRGDAFDTPATIPGRGHGSLPQVSAEQHPNLVYVYLDANNDYLTDRLYLLGALIVGYVAGELSPERRRTVVQLCEEPPDTAEQEESLLVRWIEATLAAISAVAAPDTDGAPEAPIHLVFYDRYAQQVLLAGLARHFESVTALTPLFDYLTQSAAYESPVLTFLEHEIRTLKNYPMTCQSLQQVAAYLGFDWNTPEPFRHIFHDRVFDAHRMLRSVDGDELYTGRARFSSQIPLEYAYAAWDKLPLPVGVDTFTPYRGATRLLLTAFERRRLEAIEHVTASFRGNKKQIKTPFSLTALAAFSGRARTLAHALDQFLAIERHVELADWKIRRQAPPEQRVLAGDTLLATYHAIDQDNLTASINRENLARFAKREAYERAARAAQPEIEWPKLSKQQERETAWSQVGTVIRLRLSLAGVDCDLDAALAVATLRPNDRVVVYPRTLVNMQLPPEDREPYTPTPAQLLYGQRATLLAIHVDRDGAGHAIAGSLELEMGSEFGGKWSRSYLFTGYERPFAAGEGYTIDISPNSINGYWALKVVMGLCGGEHNTLHARLAAPDAATVTWPVAAAAAQARFLDGLEALQQVGAFPTFEASKCEYIGATGDAPTVLVQGPPGTGKSFTTAFAVLARMQGAMAADQDFRAFLCCKTHAATDVLLTHMRRAQEQLRTLRGHHPDIVDRFLDPRLLDVALFRVTPREAPLAGVRALLKKEDRPDGSAALTEVEHERWCVVAGTPGGIYTMVKERWNDVLFGHRLCDCLVLDEASQMNIPEAAMAALPLRTDGQLIVVGDHRQMPPIVKHNWSAEPHRTFQEFRTYESLFNTLLAQSPRLIQFAESFRLHADVAAFLRREIYEADRIPFFSRKTDGLESYPHTDPLVAAALSPAYPLVVVVHEETASQVRNPYEQHLLEPILEALTDSLTYALDPEEGLGVVVPHRAQRAALQEALPALSLRDPLTDLVTFTGVDTVERFQGSERDVICISATESDRDYLLQAGDFLYDPRRLTVALSRAKRKLILVASKSVFTLFSTDEELFASVQLWKNLLRRTCTILLWEGEREGIRVTVWGNVPEAQELELAATSGMTERLHGPLMASVD